MKIVLLGPPGAGKGTYAQKLAQKGWVHFSMGQALRDHVARKGPLSKKITAYTSKGKLVSSRIFFEVFEHAMKAHGKKNIVFDGLPRSMAQATRMHQGSHIDAFIFIDVKKEEVHDRILTRRQCEKCGMIFGKKDNVSKMKKCSSCKGPLVTRKDDTPSIIATRWKVYEEETLPVVEWASTHYPVFYIDGHGSPTVVFKRILKAISVLTR
ncbi:MAG: nucleoside monophosphate kinase [archaeon]